MCRWPFLNLSILGARSHLSEAAPEGGTAVRRGETRHIAEIRADQIRLLFQQLPAALIATTVVGGLVVYVLWGHVSAVLLLGWLLALAAVSLGRIALMRAYFRASPLITAAAPWGRRFLIGVLLSGVVWGVVGLLPLPMSRKRLPMT